MSLFFNGLVDCLGIDSNRWIDLDRSSLLERKTTLRLQSDVVIMGRDLDAGILSLHLYTILAYTQHHQYLFLLSRNLMLFNPAGLKRRRYL
jgi:hypothetical protein